MSNSIIRKGSLLTSKDLYTCKIMKYSDHTIRDWASDSKEYVKVFQNAPIENIPMYIKYNWEYKKFEVVAHLEELAKIDNQAISIFVDWMEGRVCNTENIVEFINTEFNILNTIVSIYGYIQLVITLCEGLQSFRFYCDQDCSLESMIDLVSGFGIDINQVDFGWTEHSYLGASILECDELVNLLKPWLDDNAYIKPYTNYRIKLSSTDKQRIYLERDLLLSPKKGQLYV